MRPLDVSTYRLFLQLVKGNYAKPVKERNKKEKNGIIQFWRNKNRLSYKNINSKDVLLYDGKEVLTKTAVSLQVKKKQKQTKGAGARPIAYALKQKYVGVSEAKVLSTLAKSKRHGKLHAHFSNKAPLRSVKASTVFERVQIDLLKMQVVVHEGKAFKYILSVVDVFSRFVCLKALECNTTQQVAKALKDIFSEHGFPAIVQSDNGLEFMGDVQSLLKKKNVKIVKGRPYHPQTQGKSRKTKPNCSS